MAENASRDKSELLSAENQIQQNRREKSANKNRGWSQNESGRENQGTAAND
jgi:hypothetical protein